MDCIDLVVTSQLASDGAVKRALDAAISRIRAGHTHTTIAVGDWVRVESMGGDCAFGTVLEIADNHAQVALRDCDLDRDELRDTWPLHSVRRVLDRETLLANLRRDASWLAAGGHGQRLDEVLTSILARNTDTREGATPAELCAALLAFAQVANEYELIHSTGHAAFLRGQAEGNDWESASYAFAAAVLVPLAAEGTVL